MKQRLSKDLEQVFKANISLEKVGNKLASGAATPSSSKWGKDKVELGGITADAWADVTVDKPLETE